MRKITISNFYSFGEVIAKLNNTPTARYMPYSAEIPSFSDLFASGKPLYNIIDKARLSNIWTLVNSNYVLNDYIEELFTELEAKYLGHYCASEIVGFSDNGSIDNSDYLDFIIKLLGLINRTYERYSLLIKNYRANTPDYLAPITSESSNTTRHNDTPQNGGDFSADTYTSDYTKSESSTSVETDTIINRLQSLKAQYPDIIEEWAKAFDILFIEEANL